PLPPYHPVCTKYVTPEPVYPDNARPVMPYDPLYRNDYYIGYQAGAPFGFVPGCEFDPLGQ
ncbi:MAG: hypothetical protein ACREE6_10960, partial [Limisphaerales bacterium]